MPELLTASDLPQDFWYPPLFVRVVEQGLADLEPWYMLFGEELRARVRGLADRYPSRCLVPFTRRGDNDDVACWEPAVTPDAVEIVHDFASPGCEREGSFADFEAWFRQAVEDAIRVVMLMSGSPSSISCG